MYKLYTKLHFQTWTGSGSGFKPITHINITHKQSYQLLLKQCIWK